VNALGECVSRGEPFSVGRRKIDDQPHRGLADMVDSPDPEAANLDQAGQFLGRSYDQIPAACVEVDTVIADENRRRNLSAAPRENEVECEARFA
jgi:hypothetical protein